MGGARTWQGAGVGRGLKAELHEGNKGRDMGWDNPTMGREGLGRGNGSWRGMILGGGSSTGASEEHE